MENNSNAQNLSNYSLKELSELAKKALSGYAVNAIADTCQLSRSFVSRLLNAKLSAQPAKKSIYKLSKAKLRNGVTLFDLLTAAGYHEEAIAAKDTERASLSDIIVQYYAASPVLGLNMFLKILADNPQYGTEYKIDFHIGYFNIVTNTGLDIFGIPVFCKEESGVDAVMLSALQRVVSLLNLPHTEASIYFIITDSDAVYKRFFGGFVPIPKMTVSLFHTSDYRKFDRQDMLPTAENKAADFPVILTP
ncbi:MAG: hypothetical protein NC177_16140 [Ruminococcus flavefaciens]|nr:hypothetical protein [Ruminococcus flavefaciens]